MWIIPVVFIAYGALTPLYLWVTRGKLSNKKAFLLAWATCPFFLSYIYSPLTWQLGVVAFLNALFYLLILVRKETYISTGAAFLVAAVLLALVYNPI
ncbi:hypothetical protein HS1genome_1115 [Sulfodiicoccus acidiphilus]|uniref:Uncharacterized protein n=1 Tax=Sulfodiicoccus acidiphilus TaxID=1670455 RepID=A0A348B3H4_9CREN|nr:hypothetical protein [Sulfodiicoccus acidiphilus]BBD72726.1 hypothetical protein HS1genome_1115 [Sulfodiicoccus acidiphilus]GGT95264.1 hypothetical protein GCM10007116_10920 [Sulfodiicoccus acidiphilus]